MFKVLPFATAISLGLMGCQSGSMPDPESPAPSGDASETLLRFQIAAETVDCVGMIPMRCLVINGKPFYDGINGYKHIEGQAAQICVTRRERPDPMLIDVGPFTYHKTPCPDAS